MTIRRRNLAQTCGGHGATEMPLLGYFWKVGAALLALLFVADVLLSKAPVIENAAVDRPAIRIQSDRKWPERVVFDTHSPVIAGAAPADCRDCDFARPHRTSRSSGGEAGGRERTRADAASGCAFARSHRPQAVTQGPACRDQAKTPGDATDRSCRAAGAVPMVRIQVLVTEIRLTGAGASAQFPVGFGVRQLAGLDRRSRRRIRRKSSRPSA